MKKISILLVVAPLVLSSCAALTRYKCNTEYAMKKGMEEAEAGLASQPSRQSGSSCEGEYTGATFAKDYQAGFQKKKTEICTTSSASAFGRADGDAGNANKPQRQKLTLCSDQRNANKIESAYDREFTKAFCAPARAARIGSERGQRWEESSFDADFSSCGSSSSLKNAYQNAYKKALANNCTTAEAERYGAAEANARTDIAVGLARMDKCSVAGKGNLRSVFERSYNSTKSALEKQEAERVAKEQEAIRQQKVTDFQNNVARVSFPYQAKGYLSQCNVAADKSYVQVEVENGHPEQVLIQGSWRVIYYNNDFNKITEDRTKEALLLTGHNKKTFQKLTLPRDAAFCRAEFLGYGT